MTQCMVCRGYSCRSKHHLDAEHECSTLACNATRGNDQSILNESVVTAILQLLYSASGFRVIFSV